MVAFFIMPAKHLGHSGGTFLLHHEPQSLVGFRFGRRNSGRTLGRLAHFACCGARGEQAFGAWEELLRQIEHISMVEVRVSMVEVRVSMIEVRVACSQLAREGTDGELPPPVPSSSPKLNKGKNK